jgi:hypothetical protein
MRSPLARSMDTGLVISFQDDAQQLQEVFVNWQDRPLPDPGDEIACTTFDRRGALQRRLVGKVLAPRRIEVTRDAHGTVTTWVRLRAELLRAEEDHHHEGNGAATNGKPRKQEPALAGR